MICVMRLVSARLLRQTHRCTVGLFFRPYMYPPKKTQAIALFFYAIKMHKSSYLGTGISVANIVHEIFGGAEVASGSTRDL